MAFHHSPRIVSNGLSIYYDFGNKTCYPGSGTTVTDLIQSREGTTNGPTFSSNNVGFFDFDGSNDFISGTDLMGQTEESFSMNWWVKFDTWITSGYQQIMSEAIWFANYNNAIGFDCTNSSGTNFDQNGGFNDGVTISVPAEKQTDTWINICYTFSGDNSGTSAAVKGYLDGAVSVSSTATFSSGNANLGNDSWNVGKRTANFLNGKIAMFSFYNRVLSAEEVLQNYNVMKVRFE